MPSFKVFHALLLFTSVTLQCLRPSHQLSLERVGSASEFRGDEMAVHEERSRLRRSPEIENDDSVKIIGASDGVSQLAAYNILSIQTKSNRHFCGATIIAPHLALTAAQCFDRFPNPTSTVQVVAGKRNLQVPDGTEQIRGIKRVHIHENYTPDLDNDIALIELDEPLNFARKAVEKVEWNTWPNENFAGEEGTGWYWTERGVSHILQKVDVPILSNSACRRQISSANYTITNLMLCAGQVGSDKDACGGDSGSPLVVDFVLVGILSRGLGCGKDHTGVYTRVNAYIPWIQSKIQLQTTMRDTSLN